MVQGDFRYPVASAVPYPALVVDGKQRIVYANQAARSVFGEGKEPAEVPCRAAAPPGEETQPPRLLEEAKATGGSVDREVFEEASGRWYRCGVYPLPARKEEPRLYLHTFEDVTERLQSDRNIRRLNRALHTISASNQALLRAENEQELMQEVCRVAVEEGGFRLAWVGRKENDSEKTITPLAWAGYHDGFLDHAKITWTDEGEGHGLTGRAIRTGRPAVVRTIEDKAADPWRKQLLASGYRSFASFPLPVEDEMFGALTLYAGERDAFQDREIKILEELAGDLSFGIFTLRTRGERLRAEQAAREAEERYRALVDNTSDLIFSVDREGRHTGVNRAMCEVLRLSEEEILGRDLRELGFPEDMVAQWTALTYEVIRTGKPLRAETEVPLPTGDVRTHEVSLYPIFEDNGTVQGVRGISRDVAEQRQAEAELRQSEERHRKLVEGAPFGIVVVDMQGGLRYANSTALRMVGTDSPSDLIGRPMTEFLRRDFEERAWELLSLAKEGSLTPPFEEKVVRRDGVEADVELTGILLEFEGEPAVYVVIRDVTAQKQAQAELRESQERLHQSQKLESVGQLAGGVAHDFNNLLTVIGGDAELLLEEAADPEKVYEYAKEIQSAAAQGTKLTSQLLAFSRRRPYHARVVDLNDAVSGMDALLRRTVGEHIEIDTRLEDYLWPVEIDPHRLEQVVLNLAVNAQDAMPQGGKLTIETADATLDDSYVSTHLGSEPGEHVMLAVSDNGTGMDKETAAQVFDPFFTTKEEGKGTGLGLSTVYGIVKQFGGNIWVYSELGEGTTFKIYLPRSHQQVDWRPAPEDEQNTKKRDVHGTETVLVVEDEGSVRSLAERILSREGYRVIAAASGKEALEITEGSSDGIDLLLSDVVLPGMSGKTLADKIRAAHPSAKVLYMSGYTRNAIVHEGRMDDVSLVEKPFTLEGLARAVRDTLDA